MYAKGTNTFDVSVGVWVCMCVEGDVTRIGTKIRYISYQANIVDVCVYM